MSASGKYCDFRLISLVIVGVLGLQSFAVVARTGKWTWPFTDYSMYSLCRQDGDRIVARHFVFGTTADGREVAIEPQDLGVVIWIYERWAAALLELGQDSGDAAGRDGLAKEQSQLPTFQSRPWPLRDWLKSTAFPLVIALGILALSPAGRVLSVDQLIRRWRDGNHEVKDVLTAEGPLA